MALFTLKPQLGIGPTGPLSKDMYTKMRHAMRHPDATDIDPALQMFALILRCGGWMGRQTDPIGPTIPMRGMLQLMATFALVNQFPDLIQRLAKNYAMDFKNAYTW